MPTHAASKPVVMIPNCAATRHVHFHLRWLQVLLIYHRLNLEEWPEITWEVGDDVRRVNVDELSTKADISEWKTGETVLLERHYFNWP